MTYHIKIFFKSVLRDVFLYCYASPCFIHVTASRPTDDREAEQAHRRVSSGHSRCASIASPAQCNAVPSAMLSLSAALAPTSNTAVMQNYRQVLMLNFTVTLDFGSRASTRGYQRINNEDTESGILSGAK